MTQGEAGSLEVTSVYKTKGKRKFCECQVGSEWKWERRNQYVCVLNFIFPFQMILFLQEFWCVKGVLGLCRTEP